VRGPLSSLVNWLEERAVLHPPAATLLASLDKELPAPESARINGHLSRCAACRERLEQLQSGLSLYEEVMVPPPAGFPVEQGLDRLITAIQAWNEQHPELLRADSLETALSPAIRERVIAELSIYMGLPTARAMLQTCNRSGVHAAEVAAVIEPVVTGFLGRQTGSAVATKVARICSRAQPGAVQSRSSP
jgi:anti-sigma factor RsiW